MRRLTLTLGILFGTFYYLPSSASDGHDHGAPGALPFAPHGGKLGAAEHADEHSDHKDKDHIHDEKAEHAEEHKDGDRETAVAHEHEYEEESELFFEGAYDAKSSLLEIYPLTIDPKNPKEFVQKLASKDFTDLNVKIEFPRSRKFEAIKVEIVNDKQKGERWTGKVPLNKDIRFFVHIEAVEGGEKKLAKIHLEKKR